MREARSNAVHVDGRGVSCFLLGIVHNITRVKSMSQSSAGSPTGRARPCNVCGWLGSAATLEISLKKLCANVPALPRSKIFALKHSLKFDRAGAKTFNKFQGPHGQPMLLPGARSAVAFGRSLDAALRDCLEFVGSRKKRKRDPAPARRLTATLRKAEQLRRPSKVSKLRMPRIALQAIDPESIGASECFEGTQSPKV